MASVIAFLQKAVGWLTALAAFAVGIPLGVEWIGAAIVTLAQPISLTMIMTVAQDMLYGVGALVAPFHLHWNMNFFGLSLNTDNIPTPGK